MPRISKHLEASTTLDDIDRDIVSILQREGRRPYSKVAADLGIAESVVRYRVQRLEKSGILQIVGIADPLKVGFDLMALVGLGVASGKIHEVAEVMSQLPEASYVARIAGRFDLIVEVVCRDTAHFSALLTERLQAVEGVIRTESFLILGIDKMAYGWDVRGNVAPLTNPKSV
jgi:Lrp/AsnC family transcriptional regulator for asnA, asnC and gidA